MTRNIQVYQDNQSVAEAFAKYLVNFANSRDHSTIALSGGSTPKLLFSLLSDKYTESIDWENQNFFWGDERCVPPTHKESNYGMTKTLLFDQIAIPERSIHRALGESDPLDEAVRYGQVISGICEIRNDLPSFDLMILGMGDDGHTASIFPHQMNLMTQKTVCAVAKHPTSGQNRITITGPVLNNSQIVAFLVTGRNKAEKVKAIIENSPESESLPAAYITGTNQVWFLDEAAASLLQ